MIKTIARLKGKDHRGGAIKTIARLKAKEAIGMISSQYSKRALLGILIFIALIYGSQFVWIFFVLPGVAKSGGLESELAVAIASNLMWLFLVLNSVGGIRGEGLGIRENDANWLFTSGVTTHQYVWARTLEYALFAVVFTAPLMFVPAVTLSALGEPILYMVLFPIGLTILVLMMDAIASLITISMRRRRKAMALIVYLALIAITVLVIAPLLSIAGFTFYPLLVALTDILPTTFLAKLLIGSMVGSFELVSLLASGAYALALILLVSWASLGYEYEYKPKIAKEKKYARRKMGDPLASKHLLLIRRKRLYLYPLMYAAMYIVLGVLISSGSMMPFFAAFLIMISSQMLTMQILINEKMWVLKSLGLSGKKVVSSMLKILAPLSLVYLPIAAILLIIGGADLWLLPGILAIAIMIPPYMIWASLKFKRIGYMLSTWGSMATILPAIILPQFTPFYVSAPALIAIGLVFYHIFSKLASVKWDAIWEEIDFAARFGQRGQT